MSALKYKILRIDLVLAESYMCLVEYVGHYLSFNVFVRAGYFFKIRDILVSGTKSEL